MPPAATKPWLPASRVKAFYDGTTVPAVSACDLGLAAGSTGKVATRTSKPGLPLRRITGQPAEDFGHTDSVLVVFSRQGNVGHDVLLAGQIQFYNCQDGGAKVHLQLVTEQSRKQPVRLGQGVLVGGCGTASGRVTIDVVVAATAHLVYVFELGGSSQPSSSAAAKGSLQLSQEALVPEECHGLDVLATAAGAAPTLLNITNRMKRGPPTAQVCSVPWGGRLSW
jgi:hypothetical protein